MKLWHERIRRKLSNACKSTCSFRPKVVDYWLAVSKSTTSSPNGLRSAITLITWEIWKERNERVFNNKSSLPSVVMHKIREEGKDWILAGAKNLAELVGWSSSPCVGGGGRPLPRFFCCFWLLPYPSLLLLYQYKAKAFLPVSKKIFIAWRKGFNPIYKPLHA